MRRVLPFVVLALLAYVAGPVFAVDEAKTHKGVVVSVEGNKLTMLGKDKKEHTCTVATDAKISCDGKVCKLADLKKGVFVEVTIKDKTATAVNASTKKPGTK